MWISKHQSKLHCIKCLFGLKFASKKASLGDFQSKIAVIGAFGLTWVAAVLLLKTWVEKL